MYKDVLNAYHTGVSSDGETVITIAALQNNQVLKVTKEIRELVPSQYTFNAESGTITLLGDLVLITGETLFVLYKTTVTSGTGIVNTLLQSTLQSIQ